jgi:hypothetical protein
MKRNPTRRIENACPISVQRRLAEAIAQLNYKECEYYGINTKTAKKCRDGFLPRFRTSSLNRLSSLLL